jgi:hypothetical protein
VPAPLHTRIGTISLGEMAEQTGGEATWKAPNLGGRIGVGRYTLSGGKTSATCDVCGGKKERGRCPFWNWNLLRFRWEVPPL